MAGLCQDHRVRRRFRQAAIPSEQPFRLQGRVQLCSGRLVIECTQINLLPRYGVSASAPSFRPYVRKECGKIVAATLLVTPPRFVGVLCN